MNNFNYKNMTPFKWFVLENFPFIEADFEAINNYRLFSKVVEYLNKMKDNVNLTGQQMENLTNAMTELQNYVNNYFDNLDVQEEINNKLNEMVQDGTFENILNNTIFPEIQAQLNNQKYYVTPEEFGAVGDGVTDDTTAINNAIQSLSRGGIIYFKPKTYLIKGSIIINKRNVTLMGTSSNIENSGTILKATNDTTEPLIIVNNPNLKIIGGALKNIALFGSDIRYEQLNSVNRIGIKIINTAEFMIENVNINGFYNEGLYADEWWDSTVYNLQITACGNLQYLKYALYLTASHDSTNSIKFTSCHFENNAMSLHIDNLASHIHFNECKFENGTLSGNADQYILIDEGVYTVIFNNCFFTQIDNGFVFNIKNNDTIISNNVFQSGAGNIAKWINHNGNGNNTGNGIIITGNNFAGLNPTNSFILCQNAIFTNNKVIFPNDANNTIYITYNAKIDNNIFITNGNTNPLINFNGPSSLKSSFKNNQLIGATSEIFGINTRQVDRNIKANTVLGLTSSTIDVSIPYADYFINTPNLTISKINGGRFGDKFTVYCNTTTTFTCASNKNNVTIQAGGSISFAYVDSNLKWWITNIYNITD